MWARLSDKYGRKPTILLGILISVIANLAFGFSRTIVMLLFWRVLAGMANGILGVMRTMTAEIVKDRKHHTRAFLALPVIFNSGRVAALAIGGCLADPVYNVPRLFGPSGILNFDQNPRGVGWALEYPYALPALFNGFILAVCLLLASVWLKETLPAGERNIETGLFWGDTVLKPLKRKILRRKDTKYTLLQAEKGEQRSVDLPVVQTATATSSEILPLTRNTPKSVYGSIWTRHALKTLVAFGLLPLHNATFLHIFPVFLSMPISENENSTLLRFAGGLGLASPTIGLYLATFGICGIFLQLFMYPPIQKHIGNLGVFRLANCIFPIAYTVAPYLSLVSGRKHTKWAAMVAVLFLQVTARTMAIPSSVILLTEAAPRRDALSTIHGAGSTLGALSSAVGPVIGGMILALGIDIGAIGLVWWAWLLLIGLAALVWSFLLGTDEMAATYLVEV